MILTDREIQTHLERGTIVIDPRPDPVVAYDSTSVDLTLDPFISEFIKPKDGLETIVDLANANFKDEDILDTITKRKTIGNAGYILKPQDFILG